MNKVQAEKQLRRKLSAIKRRETRKAKHANARIIEKKEKPKKKRKEPKGVLCPFCYKHTLQELNYKNMGCNLEIGGCGVTVNKKNLEVRNSIGIYSQCKSTRPARTSSL